MLVVGGILGTELSDFWFLDVEFLQRWKMEMQVPFDFAQGRLSAPLKNASLRMTAAFGA
jgi:hypothetical protein